MSSLCSPGWSRTLYVDQAGLNFAMTLLPLFLATVPNYSTVRQCSPMLLNLRKPGKIRQASLGPELQCLVVLNTNDQRYTVTEVPLNRDRQKTR